MAYYNRDFDPPGINPSGLTNAAVDQLYKTAFGYSATDTVIIGGYDYTLAPTVEFVGGEGQQPLVEAVVVEQVITGLNIKYAGSGYHSPPTVVFTGGNPTVTASAIAVIANGVITGFTNLLGGNGYQSSPTISFNGGNTFTSAIATATIENNSVTSVVLNNSGQGYGYPPTISFINHNDDPTGRGASITSRVKDDTSIEIIITIKEAEEGYYNVQMDTIFNTQTVSLTLPQISYSGETSMNIGVMTITHDERVYGRKTKDTVGTKNAMTLTIDNTDMLLREKQKKYNMSVTQRTTNMTRQQRLAGTNTYLAHYKQAQAVVKAQIIRDANKDIPIHYTPEEQKQLLFAQLRKIPGRKRPREVPSTQVNIGKSATIYRSKSQPPATHEEKIAYNKQFFVVNEMIKQVINQIESNRGTIATAIISNNNGFGYYLPTAIIDSPTATGVDAVLGTAVIVGGQVTEIPIITAGSGYLDPPLITISGLMGTGAEAVAFIGSNGEVVEIEIRNKGTNYKLPPTVTIESVSIMATATVYTKNSSLDYVVIDNPGAGYETIPTITIGPGGQAGTGGALTATIKNGRLNSIFVNNIVTNVSITNGGKGYSSNSPPIVVFSGGGGVGAKATAVLSGDSVTSVQTDNGGVGYKSAPTVSFSITPEERYELLEKYWYNIIRANWKKTQSVDEIPFGEIKRIRQIKNVAKTSQLAITTTNSRTDAIRAYNILNGTLTNEGAAVQAEATLVIAADSSIESITVTNQGRGYVLPPIITFSGSGYDATAIAIVNNKGNVTSIVVEEPGFAYNSFSTVIIPVSTPLADFNTQMDKATQLTAELKTSTGIDLEPVLSGTDSLNSDILKSRSTRF